MSIIFNRGDPVLIAQSTIISEYSNKEKTLYYKETLSRPLLAIYLRKFSEFNDYLCEVIIGDRILYAPEKDLREIVNDKDNKICIYRGARNYL